MANTYYASITNDSGAFLDVSNSGTTSTAADVYELRMGNGTFAPNRMEVLLALEVFKRWVVQGGLDQAGANLPLPPNVSNP